MFRTNNFYKLRCLPKVLKVCGGEKKSRFYSNQGYNIGVLF